MWEQSLLFAALHMLLIGTGEKLQQLCSRSVNEGTADSACSTLSFSQGVLHGPPPHTPISIDHH